ncbi:MAG: hypothetical protein WC981_01640 [Candidatus Dojkabacteria bacterium]|jgi:hypothetical protein
MILKTLKEYNRILLLPVIILCLSVVPVFAQSSLSIGVSPTFKTLKMQPGETYSDEIVFWNLSGESDTYDVHIKGFRQIENQPGTAVILTDEQEAEALYSASKWITVEKDVLTLEPSKNTKLRYTINVPTNVTDGEFNAEIFLISKTKGELEGSGTFANLAAGTPFLIQIGDEFIENAELLRFTSDKKTYERINVNFLTQLKNLGDTHITPVGEIVVENIFKQEVARIPFNRNKQSLLRDNIGNYTDNWSQSGYLSPSKVLSVGPMKAKLLVTYRSFQPGFAVLSSEASFWIIPWKIIIAILVILLTGIIVVVSKKKLQRRK